MDLQSFVDNLDTMTCVMSVEMKEDGKRGDIRIVCGNQAYVDSIEKAWDGPQLDSTKFVPNSLYQNYFPTDLNFEEICYRAAVLKQPVHTYVHPERFDFWFNLFLLPLKNEGNIYYCTYTQEVKPNADVEQMATKSHEISDAVLSTCIKLHGAKDFRVTMRDVIKDIRKICKASTCSILTFNEKERTCKVLAEDRDPNTHLQSMKAVLNEETSFYDLVESWPDTLAGSNCLIIKDASDWDYVQTKNPAWYKSLRDNCVESIVLFPLKNAEKTMGYIWATNFETSNVANIKEALELTTYFVSSSLSNHRLLKELKVLSSIDLLTGVLNRNEMNHRIDAIIHEEEHYTNLGVVFADINGLKRVNDNNGHSSGDDLLKNAAAILEEIFYDCEVYRAGGDEFMILIFDTNEDDLKARLQKIKDSNLGFSTASFAAGYYFLEDSKDILKALHVADEKMYEDKDAFYKAHPQLKR